LDRDRPTWRDAQSRAEYSKSRIRWPWRPLQNHPVRRDSPARAVAGARFAPDARARGSRPGTARARVPCDAAWARRAGGARTRVVASPSPAHAERASRPKLQSHAVQRGPRQVGSRWISPGSRFGPLTRPPRLAFKNGSCCFVDLLACPLPVFTAAARAQLSSSAACSHCWAVQA
jgi:hypothetical protein